MISRPVRLCGTLLVLAATGAGADIPSMFVLGDPPASFAKQFRQFFDLSKIHIVVNAAASGDVRKNDYVLLLRGQADPLKAIHEIQEKGAMPILLSQREIAQAEGVAAIDLAIPDPAKIVAGIRALRENAIIRTFSPATRSIETASPDTILMPHLKRPSAATAHDDFMHWLNLPDAANPALPSLFLIGDSTVRNGRGDGIDGLGQWGWGDPLAAWIDIAKINVVNRAVGGTGVKSFLAAGYWTNVLALLKPGDIVIMQFGHNDNGPSAPVKGIGTETEERSGETVHTWGWYLRKYIAEARAKGAIPIVCTLIPRNTWEQDKIARPVGSHADWAREVAKAESAPLLDLNQRIADRYDPMGQEAVTALFADKRVHTSKTGAELNASIVVEALRMLDHDPLAQYLRKQPAAVW